MGKYIQKLTQQDIEEFLKANNFVLCYDIKTTKMKHYLQLKEVRK